MRYTYMRYLVIVLFTFITSEAFGQSINGIVKNEKGETLPFASIYIKGTTNGTTTNDQGKYSLGLPSGTSTIVCRYIGYEQQEKKVSGNKVVDFTLSKKHHKIRKIVIKANGEDPAYRIIRNAIKKRPIYNKEVDQFQANCYIKGKIKLDETPKGDGIFNLLAMGNPDENPDEMKSELDSMKGIIYLSESYSKIAYQRKPKEFKTKVLSSKVSGSQGAYGFSSPMFINFYSNNVSFGSQISPRGFVSPIAAGALRFYRYKLLETYFQGGLWVNRIAVIPKRKLEPVFSGEIHIIDNSWRIHSIDLMVTKDYELNVMDTVRVKQIHVPVEEGYTVKDQTFGLSFSMFGFGVRGNFVNVFTNYKNEVDKGFFDKYVMEYDSLALKQSKTYWDSLRVIPLEDEEKADYKKKDSISEQEKLKADSVGARPYSYKLKHILFRGLGYKFSEKTSIRTDGFIGLSRFKYNTVEGLAYELPVRFNKRFNKDKSLYASVWGRYGFSNKLFNGKLFTRYKWGKSNRKTMKLSGGRYIYQYNNDEPVDDLLNSFNTLFNGLNYLKTYQAYFAKASYTNRLFNGFTFKAGVDYQNRRALSNTTDFMLRSSKKEDKFTPNYPTEILQSTMPDNSRLEFSVQAKFQPGRRLIKYPDRIVSTSSRYPVFDVGIHMARPILNTDASYTRWQAGMRGGFNLKLYGQFAYRLQVGGFIDKEKVFVPDFTHFNGNQLLLASPYLNSFQLAPYYANSNTQSFYTSFHAEHHFNGLGTNKIPLFRKMRYYLVAASNGYYVNQDNNYMEVSAGLENLGWNLFRFFRVDLVAGYQNFKNPVFGVRIGISSSMISLGGRKDADE